MLRIKIFFSATPWRWVCCFPKLRRNLRTFRALWTIYRRRHVPEDLSSTERRGKLIPRSVVRCHRQYFAPIGSYSFWTVIKLVVSRRGVFEGGIHNRFLWARSWNFGFHKMWNFFVNRGNVEHFKEYANVLSYLEFIIIIPITVITVVLTLNLFCYSLILHSFIHSFIHSLIQPSILLQQTVTEGCGMYINYAAYSELYRMFNKSLHVIHWVISNVNYTLITNLMHWLIY